MATLPPAGSPEFMVIWEALQQFVDNQDDVTSDALDGRVDTRERPDPKTVETARTAQHIIDEMTAAYVGAMERVMQRKGAAR